MHPACPWECKLSFAILLPLQIQIGNLTAWKKSEFDLESSKVVPLALQVHHNDDGF